VVLYTHNVWNLRSFFNRLRDHARDEAIGEVRAEFGWELELYGLERIRVLLAGPRRSVLSNHPQIFCPPFFPQAGVAERAAGAQSAAIASDARTAHAAGPPWRIGLERLRPRFEELAYGAPGGQIRALLVESIVPDHSPCERPKLDEFGAKNECVVKSGVYRFPAQIFEANGAAKFAEKPVLDVDGKPILAPDGRPFAIRTGAKRRLWVNGDFEAHSRFQTLAIDSARAVQGIPDEVWRGRLEPETMATSDDYVRWLYVLFDLAWRNEPVATLRAKKYAWFDTAKAHTVFALDDLPILRQTSPLSERLAAIPDPPCHFYSTLMNVCAASVGAIDMLVPFH
jgi:hypothetical protein